MKSARADNRPAGDTRINLFGAPPSFLRDFFADCGARSYCAEQLSQWLYRKGVLDFDAMSNFSKIRRAQLNELAMLRLPIFDESESAVDGTCKWRVLLDDGAHVETVYIPERRRGTLCISSQVGCVLDCSFCATGKQGFERNLSAAEIVGQLWRAREALQDFGKKIPAVTNVVFMGMGEPLLNFDDVATAAHIMLDDNGFALAGRRVTISTAGVVPAIERVATELGQVALAVSLHAPNDELRDQLVPLNKKYPIRDLLDAIRRYLSLLSRPQRSVTFQYTLINGVNDDVRLARDLARLLRGVSCKINLIPFNPFDQSDYTRPDRKTVEDFQSVLKSAGYITTIRTERGNDIAAACGRLTGRVRDKSARTKATPLRILGSQKALRPVPEGPDPGGLMW